MLEVLERLDPLAELVMLVGPEPSAGWRPWALEGLEVLGCPWEPGDHYYDAATPVMRYRHVASGRTIELQSAATWFMGCAGYTAELAAQAFGRLAFELARRFPGGVLLNTPATTGRDLWLRKIEPGREWPVMTQELRELLRATTGQGRVELVAHPELDELPGLYEYDGRLMYAALAWGLPGGVPVQELAPDTYDEWTAGRYRIRSSVPREWPHPFGLVGVKGATTREGWRYPHDPGETFETWCDGAELQLIMHEGWDTQILESITWPRYRGKGPLDSWAGALIAIRDTYREGPLAELVRAGIRSIVLHGIGALHSSSHRVTRYAARPEDLPAEHRRRARPEPGGGFTYPVATSPPWEVMQHPELSAAVWARARRRLLAGPGRSGALHARGAVLAFRTDAIYVTEPQVWPDDGRPGRFRVKRNGRGPFPAPRTHAELLALRAQLGGGAP